MFAFKNEKKKKHPILAIGVGVFAVYGAYSMVCCLKDSCMCKMQKMMSMFKKDKGSCEVQACSEEGQS